MLSLLVKYAEGHGLAAEPGFAAKTIRWGICCDRLGRFTGLIELGDLEDRRNRGRKFTASPDFSQPELIARGETRCHFLAETAGVVSLYARGDVDEKTKKKHAYFLKMLEEASSALPVMIPYVELLGASRELEAMRSAMSARKVKPNDSVTLVCEGDYVLERREWHDWWRAFRARGKGLSDGEAAPDPNQMRCLVSGKMRTPAGTHPAIRGLSDVGGQPNTLLVSFDKEAFASYGLAQSANAAVGEVAAAAYRASLNDLIDRAGSRIGSSKVVHWFKEAVKLEDDPLSFLTDPPNVMEATALRRAAELLESARSGQRAHLAENRYYALTLSGSGGRVMVRDWMDGSFEELAENVADWFRDLAIVRLDGEGPAPDRGIRALAASCLRARRPTADSKDFDLSVRRIADRLWRPALKGGAIPDLVAAQAIARIRAEAVVENKKNGKSVTAHSPARMALLKAFAVRKFRAQGDQAMAEQIKPSLEVGTTAPAYHCGRLMAILAALQKKALGDVGAGVVQRYYAAASTTPSLVLGRLIRTSQFHLGKLEPGLANWYEGRIAEVMEKIGAEKPPVLDLDGQTLFALGYYHQLADLRRKKKGFENVEEEDGDE